MSHDIIMEFLREQEALMRIPLIYYYTDDFIAQHNLINHCEVIITPEGQVAYAEPSHIKALIRYLGKSEDEVNKLIPNTASPLEWLIDYSYCIAVYTNGYMMPKSCSTRAHHALQELIEKGLTQGVNFRRLRDV